MGLRSKEKVKVRVGSRVEEGTPAELVDLLKKAIAKAEETTNGGRDIPYDEAKNYMNFLSAVFMVDRGIQATREKMLEGFLGYNAKVFGSYYNQVSGTQVVTIKIEDIIDKTLIAPFVQQRLGKAIKASDLDIEGIKIIEDVYDEYQDIYLLSIIEIYLER